MTLDAKIHRYPHERSLGGRRGAGDGPMAGLARDLALRDVPPVGIEGVIGQFEQLAKDIVLSRRGKVADLLLLELFCLRFLVASQAGGQCRQSGVFAGREKVVAHVALDLETLDVCRMVEGDRLGYRSSGTENDAAGRVSSQPREKYDCSDQESPCRSHFVIIAITEAPAPGWTIRNSKADTRRVAIGTSGSSR